MNTPKKQHYVWQKYLKSWTDEMYLFALLKSQNKIIRTKTDSVGQERYFYEYKPLNETEIQYINELISKCLDPDIRRVHINTLKIFRTGDRLREILRRGALSSQDVSAIERKIEDLDRTIGERMHSLLEGRILNIFEQLIRMDTSFYNDKYDAFEFINFITHQFFRTRRIRQISISSDAIPKEFNVNLGKVSLIQSHILATNVSSYIVDNRNKFSFRFICERSGIRFITGDQPIISLGSGLEGEKLRFYYPLTPHTSLIFAETGDNRTIVDLDQSGDCAAFYNMKIFTSAVNQVYGHQFDDVARFIQGHKKEETA